MKKAVTSAFLIMLLASSANAALLARFPSGGGMEPVAYYDTVLNITWLRDALYARTSTYSNGYMTWDQTQTWIGTLNSANYLGVNDWRLPTVKPVNGTSFDYSYSWDGTTDYAYNISAPGTLYAGSTQSEMTHMFYNTLGNNGLLDTNGNYSTGCSYGCLKHTSPFIDLQPALYWSGTESSYTSGSTPDAAWTLQFNDGGQSLGGKNSMLPAWVVRTGDIAAVPVPAAAWLFGGALMLLGALRRRAMTALG